MGVCSVSLQLKNIKFSLKMADQLSIEFLPEAGNFFKAYVVKELT